MLNDRFRGSVLSQFLQGETGWNIKQGLLSAFLFLSAYLPVLSQPDFHQNLAYQIDATIDTSRSQLKGFLKVEYRNNSPGSLDELHVHLYPNAYRSRETALTRQLVELGETGLFFADEESRGFIDSLDFYVNGESVTWKLNDDHPDIAIIELNTNLRQGQSLILESPFRVKIPDADFSRLGHEDQTYYLTNWYPEIAVYDTDGWQSMPYLEQGEFYSEYASYRVELTVPDGFSVASTGRCVSGNCKSENRSGTDSKESKVKTVTLERDSIHSFAIFIGEDFKHKSQLVSVNSGESIRCNIVYKLDNEYYYDSAFTYIQKALPFLTEIFGPYPYDEFTIIDGKSTAGVNMEYPCITLFQSPVSHQQLEQLIVHEMSHMWNYAAVRFNERKHPWVDEGLSAFSEMLYSDTYYPGSAGQGMNQYVTGSGFMDRHTGTASLSQTKAAALEYHAASRLGADLPPALGSGSHTGTSYGNSVYTKAGLSWYLLYNSSGPEAFSKCIQEFLTENRYKRCDPKQLQKKLETCLKRDLDWFFDDLIGSDIPVDLVLTVVDDNKINISSSTENAIPVKVNYTYDTIPEMKNGLWTSSSEWTDTLTGSDAKGTISVSADPIPDNRPADNWLRTYGGRPFRYELKFLTNHGLYSDREIYWLPVAGYNEYNHLMPGVALHNYALVPRNFEFQLTPMYDPGNSFTGGIAGITRTWRKKHSGIDLIRLNMHYRRFLYDTESVSDIESLPDDDPLGYDKVSLGLNLGFRGDDVRSTIYNELSIEHHSVFREIIAYKSSGVSYVPERERKHFGFQSVAWSLKDRRTIDPYSTSIRIENGDQYLKVQLELNYRFSFSKPTKGLDIRFHFGKFVFNEQDEYNYNFRMDGWSGSDDYLFNDYYFGRTETTGLWDRQFILKDGAFKVPTAVGQSNNWNAAMNIQIDNPTPLPVRFFIDIGTYAGIQDVFDDLNNVIMYDAGVCVSLGNGAFEVYLPLFISKDIEKELEINERNSLSDKIRFVFDIKKMNPIRLRNKIHGVPAEY